LWSLFASMPYGPDGEAWETDYSKYEEGMAENRPGHKAFLEYNLPTWVKHPLTHPFSGIFMDVHTFAYKAKSGGMDGLGNATCRSPAHVAAIFGDLEMLASCSRAELNAQDVNGETPTHFAVKSGSSWAVQWLTEKNNVETTTADNKGFTPEELIWTYPNNHMVELDYLASAEKGELNEKKNLAAQEYKLKKWRCEGLDPMIEEFLERNKAKQRYHMFKTGDYEMPYPLPTSSEVAERGDLPAAATRRPPSKGKPPLPVAMVFPGQGSQYVGMLKDCMDLSRVKEMLEIAQDVTGEDLRKICLEGPEEKLSQTVNCQPIMFIAGLAAMEVMKKTNKEEVQRCQAVAGLSLGEYTAVCAAGVLDFEDCLRLVSIRAKAMQSATELVPQSMCSVAGFDRATLDKHIKEAKSMELDPEPVCQIANFLFPVGFTVGGTKNTIDKLCQLAVKARALQARVVKVGGGFHTPLMAPAQQELSDAIDSMLPKMKPPRCAIYFNVNGKKVDAGTPPKEFADLMKRQLTNEVLWEPTIKQMIMDGVRDFYEVGPLKQLKSMIKRIDQDAFKRTENISV